MGSHDGPAHPTCQPSRETIGCYTFQLTRAAGGIIMPRMLNHAPDCATRGLDLCDCQPSPPAPKRAPVAWSDDAGRIARRTGLPRGFVSGSQRPDLRLRLAANRYLCDGSLDPRRWRVADIAPEHADRWEVAHALLRAAADQLWLVVSSCRANEERADAFGVAQKDAEAWDAEVVWLLAAFDRARSGKRVLNRFARRWYALQLGASVALGETRKAVT